MSGIIQGERDKLPVCPKCGWNVLTVDSRRHAEACPVAAGAAADKLAAAVAVPSTKLGYGRGKISFEFNESVTMSLGVRDRGARGVGFSLEHLFMNGTYTEEAVAELLRAIAGTQIGRGLGELP